MNRPLRAVAPDFIAQVDLLVCFSPLMQRGDSRKPGDEAYHKASSCWVTANVYGTPARGEVTDNLVIEDMRVETDSGMDLEPLLTEAVLDDIGAYVLTI